MKLNPILLLIPAILFFSFSSSSQIPRGFDFNCDSIHIYNQSQTQNYIKGLIYSLRKKEKFSNYKKTSIIALCLDCLEQINKFCLTQYYSKILTKYQKISILLLFDLIIKEYVNIIIPEIKKEEPQYDSELTKYIYTYFNDFREYELGISLDAFNKARLNFEDTKSYGLLK